MKMTVLVQGKIFPETYQVVQNYLDSPSIENVIVSTWQDSPFNLIHPKLTTILSFCYTPFGPGIGNRNYQILSSQNGLKQVNSEFTWKARSDQIFSINTIEQIYNYSKEFLENPLTNHKIITRGGYQNHAWHYSDHLFIGRTSNLRCLFNCPYDDYVGPIDYTKVTRAETWICGHYVLNMHHELNKMFNNPSLYLVDDAPEKQETLNLSSELMPQYFHVLPRVDFMWPRHSLLSYHWSVGEAHGEYWNEEVNIDDFSV